MRYPVIRVVASHEDKKIPITALLDTGAIGCVIHKDIAEELGCLEKLKSKIVGIGVAGLTEIEEVCHTDLEIDGEILSVKCLVSSTLPDDIHIIIGRDLINESPTLEEYLKKKFY